MSPDSTLSQLLAFPPHPPPQQPLSIRQYESGIKTLLKFLEGLTASKLTAPISGKDTLLDIIDPSINPIPYLFAILRHACVSNEHGAITPATKLWNHMVTFVNVFDAVQVRYCGKEFRSMLEMVYRGTSDDPLLGIEPITTAMLRLDPTCSTLTSTHNLVVERCMRVHAYALALPILDKDIYHLPGPLGREYNYPNSLCEKGATSASFVNVKSGLTQPLAYQDHLKYFLYGASIYIACRQWHRALGFLEIILAVPVASGHVSMIQIEAYKRWCLVSVLVHGRPGRTPKNMTQFAAKQCQNVARAYFALAEMFNQTNTKRLQAEIDVGPFKADSNYSLAMLVLGAHYRFAISNLSQTYTRLPLKLIPALISRPDDSIVDTETYIGELIKSGQLRAHLAKSEGNPGETILDFASEAAAERSEADLLAEQLQQKQRLLILQGRFMEAQRRIELSKEYLHAARKHRKHEAERKDSKGGIDDDEMLADDL